MLSLTKTDVAQLLELADWLEMQPCNCASSGDIAIALPHLRHWLTSSWSHKRNEAKIIYYRNGYGWQLFRGYRKKLDKLTEDINNKAIAALQ